MQSLAESFTSDFLEMDEGERKRRELLDMLAASDENRALIAKDIDLGFKQAFWIFHKNHIKRNPVRAINADQGFAAVNPNLKNRRSDEEYLNQSGQLRTEEASVGEFPNVQIEYLEPIESKFFEQLEEGIRQLIQAEASETDKVQFLARVEIVQTICHFPLDASGRTIEDFLVFLSKKLKIPLTISQNGLRGHLESTLIDLTDEVRSQVRSTTLIEMMKRHLKSNYPDADAEKLARTAKAWNSLGTSTSNLAALLIRQGFEKVTSQTDLRIAMRRPLLVQEAIITLELINSLNDPDAEAWKVFNPQVENFKKVFLAGRGVEYHYIHPLFCFALVPLLEAKNDLGNSRSVDGIYKVLSSVTNANKVLNALVEKLVGKGVSPDEIQYAVSLIKSNVDQSMIGVGNLLIKSKKSSHDKVVQLWKQIQLDVDENKYSIPKNFPEIFSSDELSKLRLNS